jgi:DNA-binding transcriptional regulator YiaG
MFGGYIIRHGFGKAIPTCHLKRMTQLRHAHTISSMSTPATDLDLLLEARDASRSGRGADIRERAGLTRSELARVVGVTPSAISRWESGRRRPTGTTALRYGRVLRLLLGKIEAGR